MWEGAVQGRANLGKLYTEVVEKLEVLSFQVGRNNGAVQQPLESLHQLEGG